jgi:hypothetical protein
MLISTARETGSSMQFDAHITVGREAGVAQPIVTRMGEDRFRGLRAEGIERARANDAPNRCETGRFAALWIHAVSVTLR